MIEMNSSKYAEKEINRDDHISYIMLLQQLVNENFKTARHIGYTSMASSFALVGDNRVIFKLI